MGVVVFLLAMGCGDPKNRQVVTGTVTWRGQPVPTGILIFDPDVKKGNRGPQGGAKITDGRFDTRAEHSKGIVPGPHIVSIQGYSGQNVSKFHNFGDALFDPHNMEVEIPEDGGELLFVVPDSVPPAAKTADSEL